MAFENNFLIFKIYFYYPALDFDDFKDKLKIKIFRVHFR